MVTSSTFIRDGNFVPITNRGLTTSKEVTFVAGTTGAIGTLDLFVVTGTVVVNIFAVCSSDLTSGGAVTISVGTADSVQGLIATETATNINAGFVWVSNSSDFINDYPVSKIVTNSSTITQTVADATITGGVLTYYCLWTPISQDGNVVAA